MNSTLLDLFSIVVRSSLYLALAATIVLWLSRKLGIRSARLQRIAWGVVLLQGCWLFAFAYQCSIDTQWLNAIGIEPKEFTLSSLPPDSSPSEAPTDQLSNSTLLTVSTSFSSGLPGLEATTDQLPSSTSHIASSSFSSGLPRSEATTDELPNSPSHSESSFSSGLPRSTATTDQLPSARPFLSDVRLVLLYAYNNTIAFSPIFWAALAWCWAIGGVVLLIRGFFFWSIFQLSLRQAVAARSEWEVQWNRLLHSHRPSASVRLLEHDTLGPMLTMTPRGLAVVVPSDFWEERSEEQRSGILLHEIAHYERGDVWWSLLARLIVWPQWFNPMAWVALKKFDECAEWSCDESLCKSDQVIVVEYAKALVAMVEFPKGAPFAARAASGSSLTHRITRILLPSATSESRASRVLFAAMLVAVVSVGLLRFERSERAQANEINEFLENANAEPIATDFTRSPSEDEDAVLSFIKSLDDTNDTTGSLAKLKQALLTEAGKIVLGARAAQEENNLREQLAQEPTPLYISEYFEKKGERYALRADRASYADRFNREWKLFDKNVEAMRPSLKAYAERIAPDTEATKLLLRFLNDESASTLIYMESIQPRIEPDYRTVRERFDEKFVLDRDKKLVIRAGGRAMAESELRLFDKATRIANRIRPESQEWGRDLSKVHPVSQEVAKALADSLHAAYVAMDNLNDDYSIDQKVEGYFDAIESMFVDNADGLEPNEEREAEIREGLNKYYALRKFTEKIRPHLATIAGEINDSDPLAATWKKALSTDIVVVWLANTMEPTNSDPATAAQEFLDQWLVADDKGKLKVHPDHEEEVLNTLREWLRQGRMMRRRGNEMTAFASKLDHPELAKAYQTFSGKCLILRSVRDLAARQYFDGLGAWIENHFDITDDGARLKEGHEYEIMNILEQVENVQKELAKDDF